MALAKLPTTGMICPMSSATLTGMGLKPPTARFVGIEAVPAGADAPSFRRLSDASARLPAAAPVEAAGRSHLQNRIEVEDGAFGIFTDPKCFFVWKMIRRHG